MKLSKKLLNESVEYVQKYLNKKRKQQLSSKKVKLLQELIEKKKKNNQQFINQLANSRMFQMAYKELQREKVENIQLYDVFIMMKKIYHQLSEKGKNDLLDS